MPGRKKINSTKRNKRKFSEKPILPKFNSINRHNSEFPEEKILPGQTIESIHGRKELVGNVYNNLNLSPLQLSYKVQENQSKANNHEQSKKKREEKRKEIENYKASLIQKSNAEKRRRTNVANSGKNVKCATMGCAIMGGKTRKRK
jgi:hypothetical protein